VAALFVVEAVTVLPAVAHTPGDTHTRVLPAFAVLESQTWVTFSAGSQILHLLLTHTRVTSMEP
jgi:hypothetical protein